MAHYDLAIIGSGSGNTLITPDFDHARVAIVEAGVFGGTCLNVGCIPTKMFVHPADVAATARDGARFGVDASVNRVRWGDIRDRVFGRIDPISASGLDYRVHGPNTTAYLGRAAFTGPRRLEVTGGDGESAQLTADQVVVATGSHAVVPPVIAESGVAFHTSDTVMRLPAPPASMAIVGGGYIACEFAHILGGLGVDVTLIARGDTLLRRLDGDVARRFTGIASATWDVRLGTQVRAARPRGDGAVLDLTDGSSLSVGGVLVATGRVPSTAGLGCDRAGIDLHDDGRIRVDAHGRTSAAGVWALGDVSSPYQLKHVANHEARVVAHNLAHPDDLRSFDHRFVPAAVFTRPQIATVGATQEELDRRGVRYTKATQAYGDTAFGWALEDGDGVCTVLADPATGRLLGVHILGEAASILIQPAIQAMSFGLDARELARGQYWIHPAASEILENALLGLEFDDVEAHA